MSKILTTWIETLLRHRTVQVELYGDKVKREVVKGNPQGGILFPFLWSCVLNSLLLELRSRGFYVQAYADDLAMLVTGADMLWIRGMPESNKYCCKLGFGTRATVYCNCNCIFFTTLPWPGDSEGTFWSSSQAANCPPLYHTRRRLHTIPLIAERQAGKP